VTHSLGGIVLREYLNQNPSINLGRIVMLAPPNHGSEVVDQILKLPGVRYLPKFSLLQLSTDPTSKPNQLGPLAGGTLGVIAGEKSVNPLFGMALPGVHDGAVTVESARLEGMSDWVLLPYTHSFMMHRSEVRRQVLVFLKEGRFLK